MASEGTTPFSKQKRRNRVQLESSAKLFLCHEKYMFDAMRQVEFGVHLTELSLKDFRFSTAILGSSSNVVDLGMRTRRHKISRFRRLPFPLSETRPPSRSAVGLRFFGCFTKSRRRFLGTGTGFQAGYFIA